jgi:hypothetical protein
MMSWSKLGIAAATLGWPVAYLWGCQVLLGWFGYSVPWWVGLVPVVVFCALFVTLILIGSLVDWLREG